jgi:hypothetical protein
MKEDAFDERDWLLVADLVVSGAAWLYQHSSVKLAEETSQIHVQPRKSQKRKKPKQQE